MKEDKKIEKFITKDNLKKILERISKNYLLVAPQKINGDMIFENVESIDPVRSKSSEMTARTSNGVDDIVFDYQNCLNTPKDYLLLNDETLVRYDLNPTLSASKRFSINRKDSAKIVIFGSRACDTKAIGLLDKFFSREFKDPLYFGKRDNLLIITLVCSKLGDNCFCTSTNSGPYLEKGFDVQLVDIGEGYFLEAHSKKGKDFIKRFSNLMINVDEDKKNRREKTIKKIINSKDLDFDLEKVFDNLDKSNVKEELWQDLSQRCQSCGGCLLICPTCSCFYVVDKKINDKEGQRVRSLDACFYEGFTRMAGGYNPISQKNLMMKRKFYHKLWQQIKEFAPLEKATDKVSGVKDIDADPIRKRSSLTGFTESGCTGCGRCNDICPGNINWLNVIKKIEKQSI